MKTRSFENIIIPAVVFTDPEIAWAGMTEAEAKAANRTVEVVKFPWTASGRALSFDRTDGLTKLIIDPETERILGAGIVGSGAGELIGEAVVAMEMGATAYDLVTVRASASDAVRDLDGMCGGVLRTCDARDGRRRSSSKGRRKREEGSTVGEMKKGGRNRVPLALLL